MGVSGQRHSPATLLPPGKGPPGTHCTGGWVGPRAGLDTEDTGKIPCPRRESIPDRPVVQPVVRHYTAWANRYMYILYFRLVTTSEFEFLLYYPCSVQRDGYNVTTSLLDLPNVVVECLNTPTYLRRPGLDSQPRRPAILIEVFRGFSHSLQANAGIVP
jgi:hypothetical protein